MSMTFIITTRNPKTKRLVAIVADEEDSAWTIAEFETEETAAEAASNTTLCKAWGYEVVEVP